MAATCIHFMAFAGNALCATMLTSARTVLWEDNAMTSATHSAALKRILLRGMYHDHHSLILHIAGELSEWWVLQRCFHAEVCTWEGGRFWNTFSDIAAASLDLFLSVLRGSVFLSPLEDDYITKLVGVCRIILAVWVQPCFCSNWSEQDDHLVGEWCVHYQ